MNLIRVIKRNKELKPFFLNFIKHSVILNQFPETGSEEPEFFEADENHNAAIDALLAKLNDSYGISNATEAEKIIFEVAEYYMKEYSFDDIVKMTEKFETNMPIKNTAFMETALKEQSNYCPNCKSPRKEVAFENLPDKEKEYFSKMPFEPDYYLYCSECNRYAVLSKSETF